jgi:hypothetical protein
MYPLEAAHPQTTTLHFNPIQASFANSSWIVAREIGTGRVTIGRGAVGFRSVFFATEGGGVLQPEFTTRRVSGGTYRLVAMARGPSLTHRVRIQSTGRLG